MNNVDEYRKEMIIMLIVLKGIKVILWVTGAGLSIWSVLASIGAWDRFNDV